MGMLWSDDRPRKFPVRLLIIACCFGMFLLFSQTSFASSGETGCQHVKYEKVIVVGDSLADGIFGGMSRMFRDCVVFYNLTAISDGLLQTNAEDWLKRIEKQIPPNHFEQTAIFLLMGTNDLQPVRIDGRFRAPGTPDWVRTYEDKLKSFVIGLQQLPIAVHWIELPITDRDWETTRTHNLIRNLQETIVADKLVYHRLNNLLTDDGRFLLHLTQTDGSKIKLRYKDRIHFTRFGYDFIASTLLSNN